MQQIFNIKSNGKKNFVPDLFQEQLQPIKSSFVPGDEPLKYIDSSMLIHKPPSKKLSRNAFIKNVYTNTKVNFHECYLIY